MAWTIGRRWLRSLFRVPGRKAARRLLARSRRLLGPELLEDRVLLDSGLPVALAVGKTLSAYSTAAVQHHRETITYTVYNEQAGPVSGVLLTDTLQPGVT